MWLYLFIFATVLLPFHLAFIISFLLWSVRCFIFFDRDYTGKISMDLLCSPGCPKTLDFLASAVLGIKLCTTLVKIPLSDPLLALFFEGHIGLGDSCSCG